MKMQFKVDYADGKTVEVTAGPKDFVAFERQYQQPVTVFGESKALHFEWLYYLAWSVLHRTGQEPAGFDEFLDRVADVEPINEETPAAADDPSNPAPSVSSSAN